MVEFNEGLEGIQAFAFADCLSLNDVKIPSTFQSIGELCEGLEDIGSAAFKQAL